MNPLTLMHKITINLPEAVRRKLNELGEWLDLNQTQTIRESIEVRHRLQKEIREGGEVIVERKNGERIVLWLTGTPI